MSYSISSGALGSPDLLLSFPLIALALHNTTTLIITHLSFQSRNQYKSINQLLKVRSHPVSLLDSLLVSPLDNLLANLPDNLQHSPQVSQLLSPLVNLQGSRPHILQGSRLHNRQVSLQASLLVSRLHDRQGNLQHSLQVSPPVLLASLQVSPLASLHADQHPIRQLRHRYRKVSFTFKRLFLLLYIGIFPSLLLSNM